MGSFKINERIIGGKSTSYKTLLNLNWITGQFDLVDSTGNSFKITSDGESEVIKTELKPHLYAKPLKFPVGKNLAALTQGMVKLPLNIPGNIPRFFVIRKDGSGYELLRDQTVVEYFKDRLKDKKVEIIEELLPDTQDGISFICIQSLNLFQSVTKSLMYRHVRFVFFIKLACQVFTIDS